MKYFCSAILAVMLSFSSGAFAHSALMSSTPSSGAVLADSPKELVLSFGADVKVIKLDLRGERDQRIAIDFSPSSTAAKSHSYKLPALPASQYRLKWMAMGGDSHKIKGAVTFQVKKGGSAN